MSTESKYKTLPANILLERAADSEYLDEWTLIVQKEKSTDLSPKELSVVIFRLNHEWFALNTTIFVEIAPLKKGHGIPHLSNSVCLGIVNLRGQIFTTISLQNFLSLEYPQEGFINNQIQTYQRLVAVKKEDIKFTFLVDEVFGVYHVVQCAIQDPPVTISRSQDNFLKGIFNWMNHRVGLLDDSKMFDEIQRKMRERK